MTELKTRNNETSVAELLAGVTDPDRRADAQAVCALMCEATGVRPTMWGYQHRRLWLLPAAE
jgi:hypothetical protein